MGFRGIRVLPAVCVLLGSSAFAADADWPSYNCDWLCHLCTEVACARDLQKRKPLKVNRSIAYLDGRLFRDTQDGRVLAYAAMTGKRLWEAHIADLACKGSLSRPP